MTNGNDGAYPTVGDEIIREAAGLTKREYFAAMAMQGMMANDHYLREVNENDWMPNAVVIADTLIEALNKETK